jgi:hypothetical protein
MNEETVKAHQEIATRNSRTAINKAESTHNELLKRIIHLENLASSQGQVLAQLQQKYNLLLSKSFNGRGTSGD